MQKVVKEQGDAAGVKIPGFSGQHAQFVLKAILQGFGIEPGPAMRAAVATGAHMLPVIACRCVFSVEIQLQKCVRAT